MAAVYLDEHSCPATVGAELRGHCAATFSGVDPYGQPHAPQQAADPRALVTVHPERVGDEEVVEPGRSEHLGLGDGRHGEPVGAGADLALSDLEALVGLHVRAEPGARTACEVGHRLEVAVEHVDVDDERRRGGCIRERHVDHRVRSVAAHG